MFTVPSATRFYTLSLHDALPICPCPVVRSWGEPARSMARRLFVAHQRILPPGPPGAIRSGPTNGWQNRSEEHTSELQSRFDLVCRLLLEKKIEQRGVNSAHAIAM